jgi:hypothetical protein
VWLPAPTLYEAMILELAKALPIHLALITLVNKEGMDMMIILSDSLSVVLSVNSMGGINYLRSDFHKKCVFLLTR